MNKDKFIDYQNDNWDTLFENFMAKNPTIRDMFDDYCFEEFKESEADLSDYLYEMNRDMDLESEELNKEDKNE